MSHAAPNLSVLFRCQLMESLRLRGRLDESAQLLPELLAGIHPAKVLTSPELVTCAVVVLGLLGRDDEAGALLQAHRASIAGSPVAWAPVAGAIGEAFLQVSRGDEQEAAATAAGQRAFTAHGSGAAMSIARAMPAFVGTSSSSRVRSTNTAADRVTAIGQFTFPRAIGEVPAKSRRSRPSAIRARTETTTGSSESVPSLSSASAACPSAPSRDTRRLRTRRSV